MKNLHKPKSIKTKTFLCIMSVVAVILLLMYTLQILGLQTIYEITKQKEVKSVQKQMIEKLEKGDLHSSIDSIMTLSQQNDIFVEIYDEKKEIVMSPYLYMEEQMWNLQQRYPFGNLISRYRMTQFIDKLDQTGKNSLVVRVKNKDDITSTIVLVNKFKNTNNTFYLVTSSALAPVAATSGILRKIFVIILVFVLLVSSIISLVLAIYFTRPLRKLSNAAKAVAAGDYSVRIDNQFNDEIGLLIDDFNNMTTQLSKVDSMRKDLVANVSHELRTPLTMIKGYAETIRDLTGDKPEKRKKQLDVIINESDRLSSLITNMLDLSALQAGKTKFEYTQFNLSQTITALLKRYDIFKDSGYEFTSNIAPDVVINADKDRISQVICNLLDNAVNHSLDNKHIYINLIIKDAPVLEIINFGDVIEKENLPHIWERYYRIDKVGNRRVTGTGIGLSIVKEILISHNLKFGVSSSGEKGTIFWVEFKNQ